MAQHEAKHRGETNNNETAEQAAEESAPTATPGSISAAPWAADPSRQQAGGKTPVSSLTA